MIAWSRFSDPRWKSLQQSLLSRSDVKLSFGVCGDGLFLIELRKPGKTSPAFAGPVSYLVGNFSAVGGFFRRPGKKNHGRHLVVGGPLVVTRRLGSESSTTNLMLRPRTEGCRLAEANARLG